MAGSPFSFRFFRAGGVDQVDISDPEALAHLEKLDLKLWMALACPTKGLEIDARTLDLIDTDHDGRIRPPEMLAAVTWARDVFAVRDLYEGDDTLPLAKVSSTTEAGRAVRGAARRVLTDLGRPDADAIRLEDVMSADKVFAQTALNGDGIVTADSTTDDAVKQAIADAIAVLGAANDRSGKPGVDRPKADAFFDQIATYAAWLAAGDADGVRPLGAESAAAFDALAAVRGKIEDYFVRAKLATFDAGLASSAPTPEEQQALAVAQLTADDERIARWPIARVRPEAPLPLRDAINPAWAARVKAFAALVVEPLLGAGRTTLSADDWASVQARFAAFTAWMGAKPALPVGALGPDRVRALAAETMRQAVVDLIAEDAALEGEYKQIESVEKAIRFRRDLARVLRNFISFADFYGKRDAVFQAGTLYIDGRSCDLCLPVHDVARHATLAGHANAYLLYCDCVRLKDAEKCTIVAAVTAGGVDNLLVGRNGVFFDRKGDNWDATVTRIVENPTSVREAFWSPYKRFLRLVQEQIAKRASTAEAESNKALEEGATSVTNVDQKKENEKEKEKAEAPTKFDVGTIAALGVAVGGIAAFFSSMVATFLGLGMWMPLGIVALVLAISGPSMLIAWLKLSQRNIGPLLDANGWAVNAFARVNAPFGRVLTSLAELPPGARRILDDPFAAKRTPWRRYLLLVIALVLGAAWVFGKLDAYLPEPAKAPHVLERAPWNEPAPEAKPAEPAKPAAKGK
jgi:hypothetical protein